MSTTVTVLLLVAIPILSGLIGFGMVLAYQWIQVRMRQRRIRVAVEPVTARNVAQLVPKQRRGPDPVWWEFLHQHDGGGER